MKKIMILNGEHKGEVGTLTGMYWGAGMCTVCLKSGVEYSCKIKDVISYKEPWEA